MRGMSAGPSSTPDHAHATGPALDAHYRFILWLVPVVAGFPRSQKFVLGDRMQHAAMDVLEALIDATYTRRRDPALTRANLGVEKLRFFVRLARGPSLSGSSPLRVRGALSRRDRAPHRRLEEGAPEP